MSYCDYSPSVVRRPFTPLNDVEPYIKGGLKICTNGHGT